MACWDEIWDTETLFWTGSEPHYRKHMAADCIMVFPSPGGIMDGGTILESLKSTPRWKSVEFKCRMSGHSDSQTTVIAYEARAERDGEGTYTALCSSTYRMIDGKWKMIQHQHTPVA